MKNRYSIVLLCSFLGAFSLVAMEEGEIDDCAEVDLEQQQQKTVSFQEPTKIRVMTYNIRRDGPEDDEKHKWANRSKLVAGVIRRLNPDIMGLQEATANQIVDLGSQLPKFRFLGKGRGSSWLGWGADEFNPIAYDTNKFDMLRQETFSINESKGYGWTPLQAEEMGLLPRICTRVNFKDKKTGTIFWVYNTHLDNKYPKARRNQLLRIKSKIDQEKLLNDMYSPVILTGDFNEQLGNLLLKDPLDRALDSFRLAKNKTGNIYGPTETRTGWDDKERAEIDYILFKDHRDQVTVGRYEVAQEENGQHASDHRPVVADLTIASRNGNDNNEDLGIGLFD